MNQIQFKAIDGILEHGDVLIMLTDGMPELHNGNNEMYGYERIWEDFKNVAENKPEEIIAYFRNEGSTWVKEKDPDDDVTFVVIKVK
jgi:serine phosphatase RsbU (regulator of sigma subunit)